MRAGLPKLVPLVPLVTVVLLTVPVLAGLVATLGPAFGAGPWPGGGVGPWRQLFDWPGLVPAMRLSLVTGVGSTLLALGLTLLIVAALQGSRAFRLVSRSLSPLLAVPHAAAALGLAFLVAPSGWIARSLSPWLTGWQVPPDLLILQGPGGLALMAGLVVKEVPFLLLMVLAALAQVQAPARALMAATLGYGRTVGWAKAVLPAIHAQIRLPVLAVLAYGMTSVDMAMILGPVLPPPLSVQVVLWAHQADLGAGGMAASAASVQLGLVGLAIGALMLAERGVMVLGRRWVVAGGRGIWLDRPLALAAKLAAAAVAGSVALGIVAMALWSVAGLWPFPGALPAAVTLQVWQGQARDLVALAATSVQVALWSVVPALVLTIACLETEARRGLTGAGRLLWVLYLPLLVPQAVFLPGIQRLALAAGWPGNRALVAAVHGLFVLPYVYLSLAGPWRAWDRRAGLAAAALGASPLRVLMRIRLPMLLRPVLTAAAVGAAVSFGQYLPTLLVGGGRVSTITTEAVALASGGNRRIAAAYGLVQMVLPLAAFALAHLVPRWLYRHRRGLAEAA